MEDFARRLGWSIARANVVVEGINDVAIIQHCALLYREVHKLDLLGSELAIVAAGFGDEGGVAGVNRRLQAIRQVAQADPGPNGELRHRFIGLYDNDDAGRRAIATISSFDRSLRRYEELFLLHPIMPLKGGVDHRALQQRFERENGAYRGLDWEIEDLLSPDFLEAFEAENPTAVLGTRTIGGLTHRNFTRDGKRRLIQFVRDFATLPDVTDVIKLIRALRDYVHLQANHILID